MRRRLGGDLTRARHHRVQGLAATKKDLGAMILFCILLVAFIFLIVGLIIVGSPLPGAGESLLEGAQTNQHLQKNTPLHRNMLTFQQKNVGRRHAILNTPFD